jgi:hypothetical protein
MVRRLHRPELVLFHDAPHPRHHQRPGLIAHCLCKKQGSVATVRNPATVSGISANVDQSLDNVRSAAIPALKNAQ